MPHRPAHSALGPGGVTQGSMQTSRAIATFNLRHQLCVVLWINENYVMVHMYAR